MVNNLLHLILALLQFTEVMNLATKQTVTPSQQQQQQLQCFVRGGIELVFVFKRPKGTVTKKEAKANPCILHLAWSSAVGSKQEKDSCRYYESEDLIACPTRWSVYSKETMTRSYNLSVVNVKTKAVIWRHGQKYTPFTQLFDCISKKIYGLRLKDYTKKEGWVLTWSYALTLLHFNPKYEITIDGIIKKTLTSWDCRGRRCSFKIPSEFRGKTLQLCVTAVFDLTKDNYHTPKTHRSSKYCTVASLSSNYRLKVINTDTGEVVQDYGYWHHPEYENQRLNKTSILNIKATKMKIDSIWKMLSTNTTDDGVGHM